MEPCTAARLDLQLLNTCFAGLAMLLGVWLAHRRSLADRERRHLHEEIHKVLPSACDQLSKRDKDSKRRSDV